MKFKKILLTTACVTPAAILPTMLTSCSVYNDMLKGDYKPSYTQIGVQTLDKEQAATEFFNHGKNIDNYIKSELLWTHSKASKIEIKDGPTAIPGLKYNSKFSVYYIYIDYAKISNADEHRISYKITTDIQEDDEYVYNGEKAGKGVTHYKISWECINLKFDAMVDESQSIKYWLIKPTNYDGKAAWTKGLEGNEEVKFNAKYIAEIYNSDGIQRYGYECTEAATMDKDRYFVSELADLLDYFCCFWSYSLDNCNKPL